MVRALAQHRHFGRAAEALGVSQPSLTRSLKHLEEKLGVPLFDRGNGVTPTLFGQIVIERGEMLLAGIAELTREIALAKGLDIGELTIALAPYPAEISGQKAVGLLAVRYPSLAIKLVTTDWTRVVDDVLNGRADLGFADISEASAHPDLETELVRESVLRFFCRTGHPLTSRERLALEDLMQFPWVGPTVPARIRLAMPDAEKPFGLFNQTHERFRPRILVDNISAAKDIVFASDALSATLPILIDRELKETPFVLLPVELPWLRLNYGFISRRGRTPSPGTKAFKELVLMVEKDIPS